MRPHGRAQVNAGAPVAQAQCDRCGFWYNRTELQWQYQWAATHIYSLGILVCKRCYDTPFEQLRTIILPPDPPPVINARPPNFTFEETGPTQAVLAQTSLQGTLTLATEPAEGSLQDGTFFAKGDFVWVQLNNGTFMQNQVVFGGLTVTLLNPLTANAPVNGSITLIAHGTLPPILSNATTRGNGQVAADSFIFPPPPFVNGVQPAVFADFTDSVTDPPS